MVLQVTLTNFGTVSLKAYLTMELSHTAYPSIHYYKYSSKSKQFSVIWYLWWRACQGSFRMGGDTTFNANDMKPKHRRRLTTKADLDSGHLSVEIQKGNLWLPSYIFLLCWPSKTPLIEKNFEKIRIGKGQRHNLCRVTWVYTGEASIKKSILRKNTQYPTF